MSTTILMNVMEEQELRVAVIRDGRLEHLTHERTGDVQHLGNIYKARVANVEPSLDAAFLDLGSGKNGFIHIDEIQHGQGDKARIEKVLQPGQELLVQITKEAIKDKGPCVTTYLSIPGRYLVLMSATQIKGVSKRIEDLTVRKRLKGLLSTFTPPEGFGFIVRTAGADREDDEIRLDHEFLSKVWEEIDARATRSRAPACLYEEADVVVRTLRDLAANDVDAIIIDQERLYDEARAFAQVFLPELSTKIRLHQESLPLFSWYGLEERLAQVTDRKVQLPSGGTIVIEQTEALVSIDVNSARNRGAGDVETTALTTNLEAVNGIAEQLVLRDLGGLIIIDFIDMESREHQRLVQVALRRALSTDKAKIQVAPMTRFGLVEMTRQRTRPSHIMASSSECPYCVGTGSVKTAEAFEIDTMRAVRALVSGRGLSRLELVVPADLAVGLLNSRHRELIEIEDQYETRIVITGDSLMKAREHRLVPTARKGGGREGGKKSDPVRPSLLAPLFVERAKALALAKELAKMKPEQIERELAEAEIQRYVPSEDEPAPVAPVVSAPVATGPASVWDEAAVLRRLLFRVPVATRVASVSASASAGGTSGSPGAALATAERAASIRARSTRGRRRRR